MKKFALFFTAIGSVFSFSCLAQSNPKTLSDIASQNDLAVVSYHVEERINMNFGGSIRTYNVPTLDMITPKELGQNNVRIVTPVYGKIKVSKMREQITAVGGIKQENAKTLSNATSITVKPISTDVITTTERKREYVNINMVDTYERIMDKGYKSVAMIIKVADRHFFDGDLVLAAKWYNELFSNDAKDLDAVYYYRYAESLKATNQPEKAKEMMKIFATKSL